jgi:hypothetical protein
MNEIDLLIYQNNNPQPKLDLSMNDVFINGSQLNTICTPNRPITTGVHSNLNDIWIDCANNIATQQLNTIERIKQNKQKSSLTNYAPVSLFCANKEPDEIDIDDYLSSFSFNLMDETNNDTDLDMETVLQDGRKYFEEKVEMKDVEYFIGNKKVSSNGTLLFGKKCGIQLKKVNFTTRGRKPKCGSYQTEHTKKEHSNILLSIFNVICYLFGISLYDVLFTVITSTPWGIYLIVEALKYLFEKGSSVGVSKSQFRASVAKMLNFKQCDPDSVLLAKDLCVQSHDKYSMFSHVVDSKHSFLPSLYKIKERIKFWNNKLITEFQLSETVNCVTVSARQVMKFIIKYCKGKLLQLY